MKLLMYVLLMLCLSAQAFIPNRILIKAQSLNGQSFSHKLHAYSLFFIGTPYSLPMKNSQKEQSFTLDTLIQYYLTPEFQYNFNTFDCVTYLETIIALALTGDIDTESKTSIEAFTTRFEKFLKRLRYQHGKDLYFERNHFVSVDWIPRNHWIFEDITLIIEPKSALAISMIKKFNWATHQEPLKSVLNLKNYNERKKFISKLVFLFRQNNIHLEDTPSKLHYITISDFVNKESTYYDKFPELSIINIIQPNLDLEKFIGTRINVSHQGLLLKKRGRIILRHASTSGDKVVTELPFAKYLMNVIDSPTIKGINVLAIKSDIFG